MSQNSTQTDDLSRNGHKTTPLEDLSVAPLPPAEVAPPEDSQEPAPSTPPKKRRLGLIFGILGAGALLFGGYYGYQAWRYASSHEETDNATVAGHIHQVSSRITGTVTEILVQDNQRVRKGELLVQLDPRDYQLKVQQAQAALEAANRQAAAAQASIDLASETAQANTTQAKGGVSGAQAAIATAQAALTEAQTGVPAAQASLAEAQAGIPTAQAGVTEAQAGVSAAEAQLQQAEANLEQVQTDYNRYSSLYDEGAIPRQQLDAAKAAYQVAQAQRDAAQQAIEQAQARVAQAQEGVTQAQAKVARAREGVAQAQAKVAQAQEGVTSAQAQLATSQGGLQQATASGQQTEVNRSQYEAAKAAITQAQASLKEAQLQLSYTQIVAPTAGVVGRKTVEVGQRIQPGAPLMAIVSDELWVVANFKETQLENMKPGEPVDVTLDAFPSHHFAGKVDSFSPASGSQFTLLPPDNATGNFTKVVQRVPVKIILNPQTLKGYETRIVPGMSAVVNVDLDPSHSSI
jgi:membrane fusion protein (multidrug efflux system)